MTAAQGAAWGAGALMLLWGAVHLILGGRTVARPLRDDRTLPEVVRATMWMCWHMVTATLFLTGVLFWLGAGLAMPGLVIGGTILAAGIMVAGLVSASVLKVGYGVLPQGWLFVPVVALGLWSVLA